MASSLRLDRPPSPAEGEAIPLVPNDSPPRLDRRRFLGCGLKTSLLTAWSTSIATTSGCTPSNDVTSAPELVWGRLGLADGRFQKPRAMIIDANDQLYVVDKTGRIQVFDPQGNFLRLWRTPAIEMGKPTGLGINQEGHILVADTHYFRILFYTSQGELLVDRTIGGTHGSEIGAFAFVTDVVQDSQGSYYISEYGAFDRIQKYSADGEFLCRFGETGDGPLQFSRPQGLAIDSQDNLWITDACNHRLQVIRCRDHRPEVLHIFGQQGSAPGSFRYPYGLWLGRAGDVYVAEYGNHRIQKLDRSGRSLACWGGPGKEAGQLQQPWGVVQDSLGRTLVLDTGNERIQRFQL